MVDTVDLGLWTNYKQGAPEPGGMTYASALARMTLFLFPLTASGQVCTLWWAPLLAAGSCHACLLQIFVFGVPANRQP